MSEQGQRSEAGTPGGAGAEPRPGVHVTPPSGWLNDPVGGLVHGGRQHLFFQYVPSSTRWQAACHWGHLVGDDLVRWRHLPVALAPGDGDDGVWSGSAVVDESGPVLLYTSVLDPHLDLGRVALARPLDDDLLTWRKHAGGPVLHAPPASRPDPLPRPVRVGRAGELADGRRRRAAGPRRRRPALLQRRPGGLALRRRPGRGGGPGNGLGVMWECPQYVDLGGEPALVVSVWDEGRLDRVVAARGRADGDTFVAGRWQTLGYGGSAYALTTYRDRAGRLAGTAWLRHEDPDEPRPDWTGVLSLPVHLTAGDGDLVHVAPHPDVDTLRAAPLPVVDGVAELTGDVETGGLADLEVTLAGGGRLRLDTDDSPVVLAAGPAGLTVEWAGRATACRPVGRSPCGSSWTAASSRRGRATAGGSRCASRTCGVRRATVLGPGRLDAWQLEAVQARPGAAA